MKTTHAQRFRVRLSTDADFTEVKGHSGDSRNKSVANRAFSGTQSPARCKTPHCRNPRRKDGRDCHKCHLRAWRQRRPFQAAYATLRDHAKARQIEFALTFEDFRDFALRSHYIDQRGPFAPCLTVDRRDNLRGYVRDNIQPLTRAENSRKRARQDEMRTRCGFAWMQRRAV